jgi:putative N6-adenine-specific DNA methylase
MSAPRTAKPEAATFEIFLVTIPGLEPMLEAEARAAGFAVTTRTAGGVAITGTWADVWRANLQLRGASRVLARIGAFHASHLAQLDKRARAFAWASYLRRDVPVTVEATCRKSKIYHSGAAAERIATAIREELGAPITVDAEVVIKVRIENNLVTLSIDTSGGLLHKRGSKLATAKAPIRETMAALLLRHCGFDGRETVVDPMCGSGTFVIEAAEWSKGLLPGRLRNFAFEKLASFNAAQWQDMKAAPPREKAAESIHHMGSDRDQGAVAASIANASRAGVADETTFQCRSLSDCTPPATAPGLASGIIPGLVIVNPPYGTRIGDKRPLHDLYASFGKVMRERFVGWRIGLVTSDLQLARSTALPFKGKPLTFLHGGLRAYALQTGVLP